MPKITFEITGVQQAALEHVMELANEAVPEGQDKPYASPEEYLAARVGEVLDSYVRQKKEKVAADTIKKVAEADEATLAKVAALLKD